MSEWEALRVAGALLLLAAAALAVAAARLYEALGVRDARADLAGIARDPGWARREAPSLRPKRALGRGTGPGAGEAAGPVKPRGPMAGRAGRRVGARAAIPGVSPRTQPGPAAAPLAMRFEVVHREVGAACAATTRDWGIE